MSHSVCKRVLGRPFLAAHVQMDGWPLSSASGLHAQGYSTHRTILKNSYLLSSPILLKRGLFSALDYSDGRQHISFPNCFQPAGRICVQTGWGKIVWDIGCLCDLDRCWPWNKRQKVGRHGSISRPRNLVCKTGTQETERDGNPLYRHIHVYQDFNHKNHRPISPPKEPQPAGCFTVSSLCRAADCTEFLSRSPGRHSSAECKPRVLVIGA